MARVSNDPMTRNPLKFEDVAFGAMTRWCVAEASALKYFKQHFATPREALANLKNNASPPDTFWESL